MLLKAHLTSHFRMSGSQWVTTPSWLSGSWRSFLYSSSVCSCHLFCFFSPLKFMSFIVPIFAWNVPWYLQFSWRDLKFFPFCCFPPLLCTIHLRRPCSVQFSCSVMSDSLRPHESQHVRPPVHHKLPEFTQACVHQIGYTIQPFHPLLSPSPPVPNPSQPQSFPMSQLFAWGGQSIGVSASASVLPMNTQDWSPLGWAGWKLPFSWL